MYLHKQEKLTDEKFDDSKVDRKINMEQSTDFI